VVRVKLEVLVVLLTVDVVDSVVVDVFVEPVTVELKLLV
jgi:hypothetical protein